VSELVEGRHSHGNLLRYGEVRRDVTAIVIRLEQVILKIGETPKRPRV
jgi:hypothetical protein